MNRIFLTAAILFTAISLPADRIDDAFAYTLQVYNKLTSWQAVIKQTNYFKETKATLTSSGKIYYQKEMLAIRYDKPNEQHLFLNKGKLTVFDKQNNLVVKTKLATAVQSLNPVDILQEFWGKSSKSLVSEKDSLVTIKLTPSENKNIVQIQAALDLRTGYVTSLRYQDEQGNKVGISFSDIKINRKIPPSVWKPVIPKDATVIEN